jgi:hypothetical protein
MQTRATVLAINNRSMTHPEALTLALVLSITAPDEQMYLASTAMAEDLTCGLPEEIINACKQAAQQQVFGYSHTAH